jgi:hypothetical protein
MVGPTPSTTGYRLEKDRALLCLPGTSTVVYAVCILLQHSGSASRTGDHRRTPTGGTRTRTPVIREKVETRSCLNGM